MNADAWLTEFARREGQWRFERTMRWAEIAAKSAPKPAAVVAGPVVLEEGRDVDVEAEVVSIPTAAVRVASAAWSAGWTVRVVASLAVDPTKGLVSVVTVRGRRHDERFWAAWNRGGFDTGWYVGPGGLERIGGQRLATLAKAAATRAAKAGVEVVAPVTRGVLDVVEGVRGPRQWVDVLERQEVERAVGLISAAFPGLTHSAT